MSKFGERLRQLRAVSKMSQRELAQRIGMSKSSVSMFESGDREPGLETLEAIADTFNVDLDYLMGKSDIRNRMQAELARSGYDSGSARIPVLGTIRAGLPLDAVENILDWEEIPQALARDGEYFALRITGDSMEPRIREGDVVIVRKQEQVDNGDVAVVMINGDEATIKRYYKRETGVSLVAYNPAYDPLHYSPEEVEELPVRVYGKVIELRGKF